MGKKTLTLTATICRLTAARLSASILMASASMAVISVTSKNPAAASLKEVLILLACRRNS
jgi:hypothetical protein